VFPKKKKNNQSEDLFKALQRASSVGTPEEEKALLIVTQSSL
jgi:hypothetical protein